MSSLTIRLTVVHRSNSYNVTLEEGATVQSLQEQLAELTSVPPHLQKLLYKGKKNVEPEAPIASAGITNGLKITLLGNPESTIGELLEAEKQQKRKEDILKARAAAPRAKVRSTGPSKAYSNYRFHKIEPLQHLPEPGTAEALLKRLAQDPAIVHIMQEHKFSVGLLTELAPHEHPELLGLNKNAGEAILLRLRTDRYDGFRLYAEIRRVLCHELTHNVWGDHDDNFKKLNSRLNREVAEYERHMKDNTHTLAGPAYMPTSAGAEMMAEATAHVLGGASAAGTSSNMTAAERRAQILEATLKRLQAEEQQIEDMCGSAPHQDSTN
ncbi:WLM-domain-containing protein [Serendipita vermifera]|nr:WLM-domain-containing protein [Serendipita vermifera]